MTRAQADWSASGLERKRTGAQADWSASGLERKRTGAQADWSASVSLAISAQRESKRATGTVALQSACNKRTARIEESNRDGCAPVRHERASANGREQPGRLRSSRLAISAQRESKRATGTVALQSACNKRTARIEKSNRDGCAPVRLRASPLTGELYRKRWRTSTLQLARKVA